MRIWCCFLLVLAVACTEPAPTTSVENVSPQPPTDLQPEEASSPNNAIPTNSTAEQADTTAPASIDYAQYSDGDTTEWVPFSYSEGFYAVHFPEQPLEQASMSSTNIGPIESRVSYVKKTDNLNPVYALSYHDYPGGVVHSDSSAQQVEGYLNDSRQGVLNQTGGRLLKETIRNYGDYPGRLYVFELNNGKALTVWSVLRKNRMYGLHVETPSGMQNNSLIDFFMDSFRITYPESTEK